jgi:3-oxoacyl-[acyl-carrier-protein] synthase III
MLKSVVNNVIIRGISTVVPKKELSLRDDSTLYNGNEKRLKKVMKSSGFDKRRIVENDVCASDLCQRAAEILFTEMSIDPKTVSAVIFVTQTPDYCMPATSCILQHKLGISEESAAFDVNQGCAGYTYGLWITSKLIDKNCKRVLLLVGDTSSKYSDMFKETNSAPIFGDAGSATLLEYSENESIITFDIATYGDQFDAIISKNGSFRNPPNSDMFYKDGSFKYESKMDGMRVMEFTLDKVPSSINSIIDYANCNVSDIDYFVIHQANKFILENLALNTNIPLDKMPIQTLSKYGNQSCTSIPGVICDSLKNEVSSKKLKLLLSGFGIGLSCVSTILDINKIYCSGIREY